MDLNSWFSKGMSVQDYIDGMKTHKEEMLEVLEQFNLSELQIASLEALKGKKLRVIALSEDWCGDAMLNNPILLKIADAADMEVRFLLRDENVELMDQYLTNGTSRAIPIYIFIDGEGKEYAHWGPRAQKVQELVERGRASLPAKEDPQFEEKQKAFYKELVESYRTDNGIWQTVSESIIQKITLS
ncbi:thioredoxin family protein [Neobacillus notoginsengisoli]|uniref:Thioredoxin family protein n=1 Tax=Neobacillus notoginsengisoli TaxID=1578198 RepID=A0A417YHL4_9BACI|nr:thioredoxin family protein [Neobacillus notoginsengisoli]RHW32450.1 thioredoxin family protein [Neobacillus notoginsengisoli]